MPSPGRVVVPRRSRLVGAGRYLRMRLGQLLRGSPEPAPVGRPDYYKRELHPSLLVRFADSLPVREFITPDHQERSVLDVARECHRRDGVYPLNFSFPRPELMPAEIGGRPHFLSSTIPGEPFSFDSWDDYLAEYRSAYFALSTKKGGWDTFRHLEILFSGGIPLMPGLGRAHEHSLAHFPKRALVGVYESLVQDGPALPGPATQAFFRDFAREHLSSEAVAKYLLELTGLQSSSILFVDKSLPARTDYLSAFTYIGLKQVTGQRTQAAFEPHFLFDDFTEDTRTLYGRGFGYSRSLPAALRGSIASTNGTDAAQLAELSASFDALVIGNYDGNRGLVEELRQRGVPADKFVCIVGSDLPSDFRLRHDIARSGMTFFVREFVKL
jgi:hypothetical protein